MICNECETVAHCTKHGCVPKQPAPVQPVACQVCGGSGFIKCDALQSREKNNGKWGRCLGCQPYATPPAAQRQWVGLTDEVKRELIKNSALWDMHIHIGWYSAPAKSFAEKTIQLIADIEAKLKEKNT
jgi:hypothetical protein